MPNMIDFPKPTLVSVNGVELEVFEAGLENAGKPIVLCHGWPEHAFSWRYQVPALVAAGYHVIAPNQRGYGNSSRPDEVTAYDIEHLTGDLVALLGHYGYDQAIFVGHDWGAMVVWGLTLLHPWPRQQGDQSKLALPGARRAPLDRASGANPWQRILFRPFQSTAGRGRRHSGREYVPVPSQPLPQKRAPQRT